MPLPMRPKRERAGSAHRAFRHGAGEPVRAGAERRKGQSKSNGVLNNYASLEEAVYNRTMQPYSAIINLTKTGQTDGGTWTTTDRNYFKSNVPKVAIIFIRRRKLYPPYFFALFR